MPKRGINAKICKFGAKVEIGKIQAAAGILGDVAGRWRSGVGPAVQFSTFWLMTKA